MLLQPLRQRDLAIARVRPFQSLFELCQLAPGKAQVVRFQAFPVHLAAMPDASVIDAGWRVLVKTGDALANFEPFGFTFWVS